MREGQRFKDVPDTHSDSPVVSSDTRFMGSNVPLAPVSKSGLRRMIGPAVGLILFSIALWVLHQELRAYHFTGVLTHVRGMPYQELLVGFCLTIISYLVMTGYDTLALRYIGHPLPFGQVALASFVGYAFSNNIGLSMVAGGSVRYRFYSAWGLSIHEITQVVAFCGLTLWVGFLTLCGIVFLLEPLVIPGDMGLPFSTVRPLGVIFLACIAAYLLVTVSRKRPFRIRNHEFSLPSVGLLGPQLIIGTMDWGLAAAALYALLPKSIGLSFLGFLGVYLLAQLAGLASQLPGGMGVFESVTVLLLSGILPAPQVLGSLLVYRGIYYILPLLVATVMLGVQEFLRKKEAAKRYVRVFRQWGSVLAPQVIALSTFACGAVLLFSGVTPAVTSRLEWLRAFLPVYLIEISHFLGSLAGAGLIIVARGLQQRIDAAYLLTALLLVAGILFSLLKGLDFEEALALFIMMGALLPCRRYFYRRASLVGEYFSAGWVVAIILVLVCSIWLGLFSYKHVEYSRELWWQFTLAGDAPRFLRAMVGVLGLTFLLGMTRLLRPALPRDVWPKGEPMASIIPLVQASPKTVANLALLGDKQFLLSEKGDAFIMYGIQGRSWVSMGDPIGSEEQWSELIWRFREMSDRYGGWTVFYEVGTENLHIYLDLGLSHFKLGEEALVGLEDFSMEGGARKGLRQTHHYVEKQGCSFDLVPVEEAQDLLPTLKNISDAWLAEKNTREKKFSLGCFHEDYLRRFPVGIVRKGDSIIAFTNVWKGADKAELSIDLMRYLPISPRGVMDYLFVELMFWAKGEGFRFFNLGMAPLSGMDSHPLSPLWNRLGAFVFRHGEHFYNFQGLRQYKEKFDPTWEPKYLFAPGGISLPMIFANLGSLISGGMKGVITK